MAGITIERVTKSFGKTPALKDVSLDIRDGEFMVLLGPSGCGKTTLLRCVAGLEQVNDGRIRMGERDVTDLAPRNRNIAMVFQSYAVFPHMTVGSNIGFGLRMKRRPKPEIERRVREGAELLGLVPFLDRYPAQLSGGQRQRVAVARALVMDAPVLLMDEPLSNLDALLRLQARADLKRLHKEVKRTTIYVTHDQVEAMSMGDRIAVMREGVIEQIGAPMDIYDNPASQFVGGFIGSPPMNFLRGAMRNGGFEGDGYSVPLARGRAEHAGREMLLGVRAEHIEIGTDGVPAKVLVVEPLGSHALVTALVGKTAVKVQAPIGIGVKPDEMVRLRFDESRVRWMDAANGSALPN
ncbi:MAG TPA: ABC transporter ATP-binding protein [Candidatus Limnocylindria bacterium]|jgi:multiple sugar transport system ATP-binding protein|nr:ABC transporter ATP-binding protein [Candidatus Limnocylindria bacterium]